MVLVDGRERTDRHARLRRILESRHARRAAYAEEATRAIRACAYWRCRRDGCGGDMADSVVGEVLDTPDGPAVLVLIPDRHRGHALTLELPPIEPEPVTWES